MRVMKVERKNNFEFEKHKKGIYLIIVFFAGIIILSSASSFIKGYFDLNNKYKVISPYESKYKSLLSKYNSTTHYSKLYQEKDIINQSIITTNTNLESYILPMYRSEIQMFNLYGNFKEDEGGKLKYVSNAFGISLLFPHSWENKFIIREYHYTEDSNIPVYIGIFDTGTGNNQLGTFKEGLIFTVNIFKSKESFNGFLKENVDSSGIKIIYQQGGKVITYALPTQVQYNIKEEESKRIYLDMAKDVDSIVDTLKVIS